MGEKCANILSRVVVLLENLCRECIIQEKSTFGTGKERVGYGNYKRLYYQIS